MNYVETLRFKIMGNQQPNLFEKRERFRDYNHPTQTSKVVGYGIVQTTHFTMNGENHYVVGKG